MAVVRDLDTQFHQWTGKPDRQNLHKKIVDLNYTLDQICLTYLCTTFYFRVADYPLPLCTHNTFTGWEANIVRY